MTIARRLARLEATETPPETVPRDSKAELLAKFRGFEPSYPVPVYPPEVVAARERETIAEFRTSIAETDRKLAEIDSGVWPAWINTPRARRKHREGLEVHRSLYVKLLDFSLEHFPQPDETDRNPTGPDDSER